MKYTIPKELAYAPSRSEKRHQTRSSVQAHQEEREESRSVRGSGRGDRRPRGQQGKGALGRIETSSRSSKRGSSASSRGGKRSGSGPGGRTREQLYNDAKEFGIEGRSRMSKAQLQRAVAGAES